MKNLFFILLFVSSILSGQIDRFPFYTLPTEVSTTGEGVLLFYQEWEDHGVDANLTDADIQSILGPCTTYNFGDGDQQVVFIDGVYAWRNRWDLLAGGAGGAQIEKILATKYGGPAELSGKIELWEGCMMKVEDGFTESSSGKLYNGFRYGADIVVYDGSDPYNPPLRDGGQTRATYNVPMTRRAQTYWPGMQTYYGESMDAWVDDYPGGATEFMNVSGWNHIAMRYVFDPNPPDSADTFFEVFVNGHYAGIKENFGARLSDTIKQDWVLWGGFPGDAPGSQWDMWTTQHAIWEYTEGDSTYTRTERTPDNHVYDFPGMTLNYDTTAWGQY